MPPEATRERVRADATETGIETSPERPGAQAPAAPAAPERPPGRRLARLAAPLIGVLSLALALLLVLAGLHESPIGPSPNAAPTPVPEAPPRVPFEFHLTKVTSIRVATRGGATARVAALVRGTLSSLYDGAFVDPTSWGRPTPQQVWNTFAPALRTRARRDAATFSLGRTGRLLTQVRRPRSSLTVRLLLDAAGRPQAALATTSFRATGTLRSGDLLHVTSTGTFLLRPVDGRWLIVGYPAATTSLRATPPPPAPGPTTTPVSSAGGGGS